MNFLVYNIALFSEGKEIQNLLLVSKDFNKTLDNTFWFQRFKSLYTGKDFHKGELTFDCFGREFYKNLYHSYRLRRIMFLEFNNTNFISVDDLLKLKEKWDKKQLKQETLKYIKCFNCHNKVHYENRFVYNQNTNYFLECKKIVLKKTYPLHMKPFYKQEEIDKHRMFNTRESIKEAERMEKKNEKNKTHNQKFNFYVNVVLPELKLKKKQEVEKKKEKTERNIPLSIDGYRNYVIDEVEKNSQLSFVPRMITIPVCKILNKKVSVSLPFVKTILDDLVISGHLEKNLKDRYQKTQQWKYL